MHQRYESVRHVSQATGSIDWIGNGVHLHLVNASPSLAHCDSQWIGNLVTIDVYLDDARRVRFDCFDLFLSMARNH